MTNTAKPTKFIKVLAWAIDNLDYLLGIIVSVYVIYLSIVGGKNEYMIAATAGVLSILSIGVIRDRYCREKQNKQVEKLLTEIADIKKPSTPDTFFTRKSSERELILEAENEIILVQETGRLLAETCRRELVDFLRKGGKLKWICVLDDYHLSNLMSFRNANLTSPELMAGRMKDGIEMIRVLANEAQEYAKNLEVRFFPYPTDITSIIVDPKNLNAKKRRGLIRFQGFRVTFDDKIDFCLCEDESPNIFTLYLNQVNKIWSSSTKCLFLTGIPGIGKSTLLTKVVDMLSLPPNKVMGIITKDIRNTEGQRVAFETTSLDSQQHGELARRNIFGEYILNRETMEKVIIPTIERGIDEADLLILDEVGPIQLQEPKFRLVVERALSKRSLSILGIVAQEGHPYLSTVSSNYRTCIITVDANNRDSLPTQIASEFQRKSVNYQ